MMRWLFGRRRSPVTADDIVSIVDRNVALAGRLDDDDSALLVDRTLDLIDAKRWEEVGDGPPSRDTAMSDEVLVTVAANAAIPILRIDPWVYRHVHSVIVRPSTTVSRGVRSGPTRGTFSDHPTPVAGEALANAGPISLSWTAVLADSRAPDRGRNVVIHEFAHKIDMSDGFSDGTPPLRGAALAQWSDVLADEYERSTERPSDSVLRAYAWTNPAEFFAVSTEVFFCLPASLAEAKPDLYAALGDFYGQDPASR